VRTVWDEAQEQWYVSIIDVIEVLTGTERPRKYWSDLKKKLKAEGSELSEKIGQLKMRAEEGKMRQTDFADTQQLFRLIQSTKAARAELEAKTCKKVVTSQNTNQLLDDK
jgi:hypothetical protein